MPSRRQVCAICWSAAATAAAAVRLTSAHCSSSNLYFAASWSLTSASSSSCRWATIDFATLARLRASPARLARSDLLIAGVGVGSEVWSAGAVMLSLDALAGVWDRPSGLFFPSRSITGVAECLVGVVRFLVEDRSVLACLPGPPSGLCRPQRQPRVVSLTQTLRSGRVAVSLGEEALHEGVAAGCGACGAVR